jgi:hypothetical protein
MITPINYIEAILLHVTDCSITDRLRQLCSELIVLCLIGKSNSHVRMIII